MANSVDPDEMAHYEPSHLDLHCLQRCLYWSVEMKGLTLNAPSKICSRQHSIYFFLFFMENKLTFHVNNPL